MSIRIAILFEMADTSREHTQDTLFHVFPYENSWFEESLFDLIRQGILSNDVLLKLSAFGHNETDGETSRRKRWVIINDLIKSGGDHEQMRPDTQELLLADLPDAIVDWNLNWNKEARASFDEMYYSVNDLARVIYESEGSLAKDKDLRAQHAVGVAKNLWRTIVVRHHPEWLEKPDVYFAPRISFGNVYDSVSEKTKRARIIGHTALSDPLVYATYNEAKTTGVRGIASKGIESLRLLLSDEHPELIAEI